MGILFIAVLIIAGALLSAAVIAVERGVLRLVYMYGDHVSQLQREAQVLRRKVSP